MGSAGWGELAAYLAALPAEERGRLSRYAALGLPDDAEGIEETLRAYAAENPAATPSGLLATTGAQAGFARDLDLAKRAGASALELAQTVEDRQLAHVCLAQIFFQNRRQADDLQSFVEHCEAAIRLGHAGTFCYERLAVLYEYRGEKEEAAEVCRRAIEVLGAAGDPRSTGRFRERLERLSGKV